MTSFARHQDMTVVFPGHKMLGCGYSACRSKHLRPVDTVILNPASPSSMWSCGRGPQGCETDTGKAVRHSPSHDDLH